VNPARLAEIRQRLEAATPRPWRLAIACDEHGDDESLALVRAGYADIATATNANAAFIANAPDDIADLLAEVERLTAAKPANVARWEAEPFRYPGYILLLGRSNRRVAQIDRPRASGGEWRACWRPNKRSFTTEAEARAYLESEAKRRGWTVKP
jgi:hypothetical protein